STGGTDMNCAVMLRAGAAPRQALEVWHFRKRKVDLATRTGVVDVLDCLDEIGGQIFAFHEPQEGDMRVEVGDNNPGIILLAIRQRGADSRAISHKDARNRRVDLDFRAT